MGGPFSVVLVTCLPLNSFSLLLPWGEGEGRDGGAVGLRGGGTVRGDVPARGMGYPGVQTCNFISSSVWLRRLGLYLNRRERAGEQDPLS